MIDKEKAALLEAARAGDEAACTKLLEDNAGLIWSIVRRYQRRQVETEDLYQLACLGFLKAVRGFDGNFGTQFSTYAVPKIAGEIRRFLRDDGPVKVSRSLKEQGFLIWRARETLRAKLEREPTLSELSGETGLGAEEIAAAELAGSPVTSLQAETGENGTQLEQLLGTQAPEESLVEQVDLHRALKTLPPREQSLIFLRYYRGFTQERVAGVLGISQVQVSRLEKRSIEALRKAME